MQRFIAVRTMPVTEEQWKENMDKGMPPFPPGVSWNFTYCDFTDGKYVCEWETPNKETVEQGFKAMNMPFDAVYPVRLFNVAKAELEA